MEVYHLWYICTSVFLCIRVHLQSLFTVATMVEKYLVTHLSPESIEQKNFIFLTWKERKRRRNRDRMKEVNKEGIMKKQRGKKEYLNKLRRARRKKGKAGGTKWGNNCWTKNRRKRNIGKQGGKKKGWKNKGTRKWERKEWSEGQTKQRK